jgi:hypothetical protein
LARYTAITCSVLYREICAAAAVSPNRIDLDFVDQGLHDRGGGPMAVELQRRIDAADAGAPDAVLLGFALCNNGVAGLRAGRAPLVVPRAHDCITLLLGSKERYREVFDGHPGSYYLSGGWIERATRPMEPLAPGQAPEGTGWDREKTLAAYVEKYGEENAKYLMETLHGWSANYQRIVFIDNGLGDAGACRLEARRRAADRNLEYVEVQGDNRLMRRLTDGPPWDEGEFLVVPPGREVRPSYDERIVEAREPSGSR